MISIRLSHDLTSNGSSTFRGMKKKTKNTTKAL